MSAAPRGRAPCRTLPLASGPLLHVNLDKLIRARSRMMGNQRVASLRAERQAVLEFFGALSPEEWDAPSGCPGWSVKGVLSHMSAAFHGCFTPWFIGLMRTKELERSSDRDVEKRSDRAPAQVLAEYRFWSARYLNIQPLMKATGLDRVKIP